MTKRIALNDGNRRWWTPTGRPPPAGEIAAPPAEAAREPVGA